MSAAIAKACIVCQAASSKYKCPKCSGPTCSLECSKKHKTDEHSIEQDGIATVGSDAATSSAMMESREGLLPSLRQFSNPNEKIISPAAHRFTNIDKFVPMNAYGEANMLEDFEYLQFMGQSIASLGRDLVKKGWYKPETTSNESRHNDHRNQNQSNGHRNQHSTNTKLSAEVRNRQQFETWIRRLKVPIMLLPDGMSARKENQTKFKAQNQQLMCSVQISFPSGNAEDRRAKRVIQHHVSWSQKSIGEIVKSEILKRLRINTSKKNNDDVDRSDALSRDITSWEAMIGKQIAADESSIKSFEDLKEHIMIAIPVHCDKLRNETSAKFLEWWQRQVRNGMVLEGGLKFDEEKKLELERRRNGDWAPIEGLGEDETQEGEKDAEKILQGQSSASSMDQAGLISNDILSRLTTQRDVLLQKKKKEEIESAKAASSVGSTDEKANKSISSDLTAYSEGVTNSAIRHLVVLKGDETIEDLLRRLEKGYGIVEYPHFEIWRKEGLLDIFAKGKAKRVELSEIDSNPKEGEKDIVTEKGSKNDNTLQKAEKRPIGSEEADEKSAKKVRIDATSQSGPSQSSALVGLSAYDSSDEDVSEKDEEDADEEENEATSAQAALESEILDHFASQVAGSGNNNSLADIARAMGMVNDDKGNF